MKKIIALVLVLSMVLCLCACGKSKAVTECENRINAIGQVSLDSKEAIEAAVEAYEALTDKEKESVAEQALILQESVAQYERIVKESKIEYLLTLDEAEAEPAAKEFLSVSADLSQEERSEILLKYIKNGNYALPLQIMASEKKASEYPEVVAALRIQASNQLEDLTPITNQLSASFSTYTKNLIRSWRNAKAGATLSLNTDDPAYKQIQENVREVKQFKEEYVALFPAELLIEVDERLADFNEKMVACLDYMMLLYSEDNITSIVLSSATNAAALGIYPQYTPTGFQRLAEELAIAANRIIE